MRPAAKDFYLAFFFLFGQVRTKATTSTLSKPSSAEVCAIDPTAIVSDACASYSALDTLNRAVSPYLKSITQSTDFFAYYRLNLFDQQCPVRAWDDETGTCGNIACKVDTLEDEKDIPVIWRAEELSKLEGPKAAHPGRQLQKERGEQRPLQGDLGEDVGESCVVEYDDECDDRDYCVPEDESATAKGDYVSLVDNPERFTGYAGSAVWDAIYKENCFSKESQLSGPTAKAASLNPFQAANDLRTIIQKNAPSNDLELDDECLEKRVFYRIVSGMHASVSTHICFDYLNKTTGKWGPNLECYRDRLATHPERVSNLYFDYAILLRAVTKLRTYLKNYTFCSGDASQNRDTKNKILQLANTAATYPRIFDENTMFQDPDVSGDLKEDFRNRFRNVSRLMDCVGCDKCRLWGKLQTVGYGTALKVLFEYDELKNGENPPLRRTELVALVNTLDRVSSSLTALNKMRDMVAETTIPSISEPDRQEPSAKMKDHSEAKGAIAPDFESDALFDEEEEPNFHSDQTIGEIFRDEWNLVWRTYIYVLKSWISIPPKMFRIIVIELSRLWSFWLGLPIPERSWEFQWRPQKDEL
ncbi:hypothetical protein N7G274_005918 [Stereocaulon virgatum]|uniref:Endoplasmic oxidoreductin n=1 Tax=Stereocaulon virgatum TaxID=373712 RepID=A0ABR4A9F8_9LECA